MKRFAPSALLLATIFVVAPSCVLVVGAGIGAGAMYALGEDSIELYLEHSLSSVYAAAQAQLEDTGEINLEDMGSKEAFLEGIVEDSKISIFLTGVTDNTTRMVVKARKWRSTAPDLELSQQVADRIAFRAK